MNDQLTPKGKYILVDTCIIQAASHHKEKEKALAVNNCLQEFNSTEYKLAISQITVYESLFGLWGKRAQVAIEILNKFEQKEISQTTLVMSSMLGGLYKQEQNRQDISVGDQIIASTAILENALILTENHKDFPSPYFVRNRKFEIIYTKSGFNQIMHICLYEPDVKLIGLKIENLDRTN